MTSVRLNTRFLFEEEIEGLDERFLSNIVSFALCSFYGQVGSAKLQYEITEISTERLEIVMLMAEENFRKVSAALALLGRYAGVRVKIVVTRS